MKMYKSKPKTGFTLIEVLVSVGFLGLVFAALAGLMTKSLSAAQHARDRAMATEEINTAMEYWRENRDASASWADFVTSGCVLQDADPAPINPSRFTLTTTADAVGNETDCSQKVHINIKVSWDNNQYSVEADTYFANFSR